MSPSLFSRPTTLLVFPRLRHPAARFQQFGSEHGLYTHAPVSFRQVHLLSRSPNTSQYPTGLLVCLISLAPEVRRRFADYSARSNFGSSRSLPERLLRSGAMLTTYCRIFPSPSSSIFYHPTVSPNSLGPTSPLRRRAPLDVLPSRAQLTSPSLFKDHSPYPRSLSLIPSRLHFHASPISTSALRSTTGVLAVPACPKASPRVSRLSRPSMLFSGERRFSRYIF